MNLIENAGRIKARRTKVVIEGTMSADKVIIFKRNPEFLNNIKTPPKLNFTEDVSFRINGNTQEISNTITEEQKDIIQAILENPESHSIEILIDRLYEIQRQFERESNFFEINMVGALLGVLSSLGIQEEFITNSFEQGNTIDEILIIILHYYLFKICYKSTKELSQVLYVYGQNKAYKKVKDSNR